LIQVGSVPRRGSHNPTWPPGATSFHQRRQHGRDAGDEPSSSQEQYAAPGRENGHEAVQSIRRCLTLPMIMILILIMTTIFIIIIIIITITTIMFARILE